MLSRLKIHWDPAQMQEGYAKDKIQKLVNDCKIQHKYIPNFPKGSSPTYHDTLIRERNKIKFELKVK